VARYNLAPVRAALLFVELVSIAKTMIVFGGALLSSWAPTAWIRCMPIARQALS
jgi:hypothetical protein